MAKKKKDPTPGTVPWLKEEIRKATQEVNKRFYEAKQGGKSNKQLNKWIARLRYFGSKPSIVGKNRGEEIGLGFRGKKKVDLERQLSELNRVIEKDIWTPKGRKKEDERHDQAYRTFSEMHPNWSRDKYNDFVQLLGTAPSELLQAFGYERSSVHRGSKTAKVKVANESFVEAYSYAYDKNVDLLSVMLGTYSEIQGMGYGQEQAIDALKTNIEKVINGEVRYENATVF